MKILQIPYSLGGGGMESFITSVNSCSNVFDKPFDFLLYTNEKEEGFFEGRNKILGSNIYHIGSTSRISFIRAIINRYRAYKFLKNNEYDVVHIHYSNVFCLLEVLIARFANVRKVIVHSHSTKLGNYGIRKIVKYLFQKLGQPLLVKYTDVMLGCSTEACEWMFGKRNVKLGKTKVIKNGIYGEHFYFDAKVRSEFRDMINWPDKFIIGTVGRMAVEKNQTFLLDIFSELLKLNPNARLLILGDGILKNELIYKAKKLGVFEYCNFYGTSKEINCFLQAMDVFVFPSLYEGLPVAGIEAQAAGLPIVASNTISEELKITDNLHWMDLNQEPSVWASKILDIAKFGHSDTRNDIIAAGYDIVSTAKLLKELYEVE